MQDLILKALKLSNLSSLIHVGGHIDKSRFLSFVEFGKSNIF